MSEVLEAVRIPWSQSWGKRSEYGGNDLWKDRF